MAGLPVDPVTSSFLRDTLRATLTLALAALSAWACVQLHVPLPWMVGPLVATSLASIAGAPTLSLKPLRNAGQWVIGSALGLYFTPQVMVLVASLWWAIVLAIVWALLLGAGFGTWLHHRFGSTLGGTLAQQRATCWYASVIGGASEMTLLAERQGARTDLVAASHSLRIMMVTISVPFAVTFAGVHGLDAVAMGPRTVNGGGLVLLTLATLAGGIVMQRLGRANPWLLGALLVSMGLTMAQVELSALPTALTNAAQLFIGISLGVRFSADFIRAAPRWLLAIAIGTAVMVTLSAAFAFALGWLTGLHPATLVLSTSPGGIAEMAITAKVLQLGVPVVTAFQVCRLVTVLLLADTLHRAWAARLGRG